MIAEFFLKKIAARRWRRDRQHRAARAALPMATRREIAKTDAEHEENPVLAEWRKQKLEQGYAPAEVSRALAVAIVAEAATVGLLLWFSRPTRTPNVAGPAIALCSWPRVIMNAEKQLIRNELAEALKQ